MAKIPFEKIMNFKRDVDKAILYKGNYIYEDNGVYTSFITNNYYESLSACKTAITKCINNGWELVPVGEAFKCV